MGCLLYEFKKLLWASKNVSMGQMQLVGQLPTSGVNVSLNTPSQTTVFHKYNGILNYLLDIQSPGLPDMSLCCSTC